MIRDTRFLISQRPYAVDLTSLRVTSRFEGWDGTYYRSAVNAVWFRRRKGVTVACTGTLSNSDKTRYTDAPAFLEAHTDGRYGGDCAGRWDGNRYWGAQEPATIQAHLELLVPMLVNYPEIPPGYDGWWRFDPAQ